MIYVIKTTEVGLTQLTHPDFSSVSAELSFDLISDPTEFVKNLLLGALGMGWVVEPPMEAGDLAGVGRADLVGVTADGDDDIDPAGQELVHVLRGMGGDIHPGLGHDLDRKGVHIARRLGACAEDLGCIPDRDPQETFGHMAATGVAGAKDEDGRHGTHRGGN